MYIVSFGVLVFIYFSHLVSGQSYGIFAIWKSDEELQKICIAYNENFHQIPKAEDQNRKQILDLYPNDGCQEPINQGLISNKIVLVARGNCTFSEKAEIIQKYNGKAVIIVSKSGLLTPYANQTSDYDKINITVAMMTYDDYKPSSSYKDLEGDLYSPDQPRVDYNLILVWLIAVGTVAAGAFWSGLIKHSVTIRTQRRSLRTLDSPDQPQPPQDISGDDADNFHVTPTFLIIFVILMVGMLVALYYFYDYLVYVVIVLFCLASSIALHSCLYPLVARLPCGQKRLPGRGIPGFGGPPEIRSLILTIFCVGFVVWWGVERNANYAWVPQDLMGIAFCIYMMKTIRLRSFKSCTILLLVLFLYDIFFVFITPLLTKKHESIMVDVATGSSGKSGEQLPMVFKVPRLIMTAMSVCHLPYSLLGFGDVLIPGLLVSYCHGFDLFVQSGRVYYIASLIAYAIGLVLTFIALALMKTGQPALLYLVPCTLLASIVIALIRGELKMFWRGEMKLKKEESVPASCDTPTSVITTNGTTSSISNRRSPTPIDESPVTPTENENARLVSH